MRGRDDLPVLVDVRDRGATGVGRLGDPAAPAPPPALSELPDSSLAPEQPTTSATESAANAIPRRTSPCPG